MMKPANKNNTVSFIFCGIFSVLAIALFAAFSSVPQMFRAVHFDKIMGADISFLPSLEESGRKFYDKGVEKDAIQILKDHGFNYIRLRIFNNPRADSGYSKKGYCDLGNTMKMALRAKAASMGFLLDFHYSDNWADPGKQYKPQAWKSLNHQQMQDSIREFTKSTLLALKKQGTMPDMVQVGNEINHGILWPNGRVKNLDTLADFLKAGIVGVRLVSKSVKIMLHIACGGQNAESRYFLDHMIARGVKFDIIGESYYPEWHGPVDSLKYNINDLNTRYKQDVIIVEYSQRKKEVNDIAFTLPGNKLKGTFIWEPLSYGEAAFDRSGNTNALINIYSDISRQYNIKQ